MAIEELSSDSTTEDTEMVSQEEPDTEMTTAEEASHQPAEEASESAASEKYEAAKKALLADLHKERSVKKSLQEQVESLNAKLSKQSQATEQLEEMTKKYNRLEEFLLKSGNPIAKILDSRSFSEMLFSSDDDVTEIIKKWNSANPSATQTALKSNSTASKVDLNSLLRAAIQ